MHYLDVKEIEKKLNTSFEKGLDESEVLNRIKKYGKNKVESESKKTLLRIILDQFNNSILILLLIASAISFLIGERLEGIAILLAVIISIGFGTYLEYKADRSLEKLKKMTAKKAMVLREGKIRVVPVEELVPGDILIIQSGSYIGADAVIIESNNLHVDESHLTGESIAVAKRRGKTKKETPLAERFNMLFAGSYAIKGEGKAVVIATGRNSELGAIASELGEIESEETPLMKNLNRMGKKISLFSIILILLVFTIGFYQGRPLFDMFVYSVTLAVAAVPEGLTAVLTIMLTLSVLYMAKNNALVKKLSSVETIGNVNIIGVDKTGTITEGKLALVIISNDKGDRTIGEYEIDKTLELAILANSAKKGKNGEYIGDDIDIAIMRAAEELGADTGKTREKYGLVKIIPFSNKLKAMGALLKGKIKKVRKGAYENIIKESTHIEKNGKIIGVSAKEREKIKRKVDSFAEQGYRIIGVLYEKDKKKVLSGFLIFIDKEKRGVKKAIEELKRAGIKVMMLTGDNIKTATAIAKRVGIEGEAVEWKELENMSNEKLSKEIEKIGIIARSTPKSKLKIVETAISKGNIIGITGDGINDALALKKAHVGVVMGRKGSDISKEVADLILLDDNFYTMVKAIRYGRNLIKNIINFIRYQFTANISALMITISSLVAGISFPLTPLQLLWINIIMDGPPALSLGFEKPNESIMREKPRKGRRIFDTGLLSNIMINSLYIAIVVFYLFYSNLSNPEKALSLSFNTFVFFQLFNTLNCRSMKEPFYKNLTENKILLSVVLVMAVTQIVVNTIPIVNEALNTQALGIGDWIMVLITSGSILIVEEIKKNFLRIWKNN